MEKWLTWRMSNIPNILTLNKLIVTALIYNVYLKQIYRKFKFVNKNCLVWRKFENYTNPLSISNYDETPLTTTDLDRKRYTYLVESEALQFYKKNKNYISSIYRMKCCLKVPAFSVFCVSNSKGSAKLEIFEKSILDDESS